MYINTMGKFVVIYYIQSAQSVTLQNLYGRSYTVKFPASCFVLRLLQFGPFPGENSITYVYPITQ